MKQSTHKLTYANHEIHVVDGKVFIGPFQFKTVKEAVQNLDKLRNRINGKA